MNSERILMVFLLSIAFALLFEVVINPVPVKAAIVVVMPSPHEAQTTVLHTGSVPAITQTQAIKSAGEHSVLENGAKNELEIRILRLKIKILEILIAQVQAEMK